MSRKRKIEVGSKVFWNGDTCEIMGALDRDHWVVVKCEDRWYFSEGTVVRKEHVEPIIDEVFQIGDRVKSQHYLTGTVTGFEFATNRVICISDAAATKEKERQRWAYKAHELELVPRERLLKVNAVYQLRYKSGATESVRALEIPDQPQAVFLYGVETGKFICTVPRSESERAALLKPFTILVE